MASGKSEFLLKQVKKILFSCYKESLVSPYLLCFFQLLQMPHVEKVSRALMVPLATRGKLVPATLTLQNCHYVG